MSEVVTKQVWLNLNTGQFSNSWYKSEFDVSADQSMLDSANETNWKLIEYQCPNDPGFDFYSMHDIMINEFENQWVRNKFYDSIGRLAGEVRLDGYSA